jgi:tetratricopeptide (TPR) repeat protein
MDPSIATIASRLNNEGVGLIENGLYHEAISTFSQGLTLVKQVLALQGDEDERPDEESGSDCMGNPKEAIPQTPSCHFRKMQEIELTGVCVAQEDISCGAPLFIFKSPIFIPAHATDLASFNYYVKSSFILLYNLALSHHLSALESNNSRKRLRKALSLYELAYTLQMTENVQLTVLQTMAIVNNLGQIHTALENEAKSKQCFQHLLSTIVFLNDCGERESVEQMDGFVSNVMPLILKGSASASAA